jgi:hypothetical protein
MKASPIRRLICVSEIFRSRVIGCTSSGKAVRSMNATALTMHITAAIPHDAFAMGGVFLECIRSSRFLSCDFAVVIFSFVSGFDRDVVSVPGFASTLNQEQA